MQLELSPDVTGELVSFDGKAVAEARLPSAQPPGRPIRMWARTGEDRVELEGKVIGSRLDASGSFLVRVRLINLRKPVRELLQAHTPT